MDSISSVGLLRVSVAARLAVEELQSAIDNAGIPEPALEHLATALKAAKSISDHLAAEYVLDGYVGGLEPKTEADNE
jgi:hypothetical protein